MSYYPHNQPILTTGHEPDSEPTEVLQSATNTLLPTATIVERSQAGSPIEEHDYSGRDTPVPMPSATPEQTQ